METISFPTFLLSQPWESFHTDHEDFKAKQPVATFEEGGIEVIDDRFVHLLLDLTLP